MILIDSNGWIEYFTDGPNSDIFAAAIYESKGNIAIPTIVIYEVFKKILNEAGEEKALQVIGQLKRYKIIVLDEDIALTAAEISCENKIPMADSIVYATAKTMQAEVWTQDDDFKDLPNVKYFKKKKARHDR